MKRKYMFSILILTAIVLFIMGIGWILKIEELKKSQGGPDPLIDIDTLRPAEGIDGDIITGTIVKVDSLLILENPSQKYSVCSLSLSDDAVIYVDGKLSDITQLTLGQTAEVEFSGNVAESFPSIALGVTKICATTKDVSLLNGTITEIAKGTILVQDINNPEKKHTLSISEDTFVCIQGFPYGIQSIEVGHHVEIAYKEETDGELPIATIVLVK